MTGSKRLLEDFHVLYILVWGQSVTAKETKVMERTPPLPLEDSSNTFWSSPNHGTRGAYLSCVILYQKSIKVVANRQW